MIPGLVKRLRTMEAEHLVELQEVQKRETKKWMFRVVFTYVILMIVYLLNVKGGAGVM